LNARVLHILPFANVEAKLVALGLAGVTEAFWEAVRNNLERLRDTVQWWRIVTGPIDPVIAATTFLEQARTLLPSEPWDETTWSAWTGALAAASGFRGKALYMPLRQALTGLDHGPDMKKLLPLIGAERAAKRLGGERA
jgi:glutamyl-tRNA synthetase